MEINRYFIILIFALVMTTINCNTTQYADLALINGTIYQVDRNMSTAEAVAIFDGKFIAVGTNEEIKKFITEGTKVLDLEGKTVVPGLIDSHYHFMGVGRRAYVLNLDGTKSLDEFLSKIDERVKTLEPGEWLRGRGWIEEDWTTKRFPTRYDLDRVTPANPVFLKRADGHAAVVNSLALKVANITNKTPDPKGGKIVRDHNGDATGMLLEDNAQDLVEDLIPVDTSATIMRKYALKANDLALGYGLTTVHNMGQPWKQMSGKVWNLWQDMYKKGELGVRIINYVEWPFDKVDKILRNGLQVALFNNRLAVRGIKITLDGALGSRGAALLEPYSDAATKGMLLHSDDQIYPVIKKALEKNVQIAIHAIGDRANRKALDLYARAMAEVPKSSHDPRFRIEHSQIVHPDDIPRFKELGVIPSMQPSHAIGDLHFAIRRLGLLRMERAYAWRKFINQGSYIPAGSDAPVEEGNPIIEFYAATVRKDTTGFSAEGWLPEYKMTREEALQSLTIWGAKAAFMEGKIGSIEVGKYADLVVLDKDLMTEPEERLFDIKVMKTFVSGDLVFNRMD